MVTVLALDLGTRTGWALHEAGRIASGVQTFDVRRGESPGMRYLRLDRWLDEVAGRVTLLVYEQPHMRGGHATEVLAGFATRVQAWCALRGVEHQAVHTATLKKWTTGSGRGDKAAMLAAVRARWPEAGAITDDNQADALALLHYARAELAPAGLSNNP